MISDDSRTLPGTTAASSRPTTIVVTIGAPHDRPWWWAQLDRTDLRDALHYERVSSSTGHQLGLKDLPAFIRRMASIIRRARRERCAHIITFEADLSCYMIGLLQLLPGFGGPKHTIVQFISSESAPSLRGKLHDLAARISLASVHRLICSSRAEGDYYRERFRWRADKVAFVPLHTDRSLYERRELPVKDYIIAAGRTFRDYATLARAVAGTGIRTRIVCGKRGPGITELPPEVEVVSEIPLTQLIDLMSSARAVILPLEDRRISTGQTVLLQAMALGRPVVSTLTAGTADYLVDGQDGLLVPPGDVAALRRAIERLWNDRDLAERIGAAGKATIGKHHLPMHYALGVSRVLGCTPGETAG